MADLIQIRRDTAANWTSNNPTLASGEQGYETDTNKMKIGDGSTAWTSLDYFVSQTGLEPGDIGSTVQGYDADTAKYDDATANFTGTLQQGGSDVVVDTDIGSTVQGYDADTAKYDDATANFTGTLQNAGSNVVVDTDIGSTVQAYDADTAKYDDTTANFTGTLQNAGSNVVVDTDIGSTVQAYDADTAKYDDTTANFTGTLQNAGSNVVVDTDIGSTVQAYDSNLTSFVSAFTLPTSDGTANQILKTDGSGTLSFVDAASGGGGGSTATLTVAGGVSQGDIIVYNTAASQYEAAGEVTISAGTTPSAYTLRSTSITSLSGYTGNGLYHTGYDKAFITTYESSTRYYRWVTFNNDYSLTFSSAASMPGSDVVRFNFQPANNKIAVIWYSYNSGAAQYNLLANVGTVNLSTGVISWEASNQTLVSNARWAALSTNGSGRPVYDSNDDKWILCYKDENDSNKGKIVSISYNSSTDALTVGTPVEFLTSVYSGGLDFDPNRNSGLMCYATSSVVYYRKWECSSGTITLGTETTITNTSYGSSGSPRPPAHCIYNSARGKFLFLYGYRYSDGFNYLTWPTGYHTAEILENGTVSLSNVGVNTSGSARERNDGSASWAVFDSATGTIMHPVAKTTYSARYLYMEKFTQAADGTVSKSATNLYNISEKTPSVQALSCSPDANYTALIYYGNNNSTHYSFSIQNELTTTNITNQIIGAATETIADGASGSVSIIGGVDNNQTGLTANQTYYVISDGTLSTTADDYNVEYGYSLSTTEILTLSPDGSDVVVDSDIGTTVQAYDATILKAANIGSTVQAYDADTAKYDDTTANFTGTLQNGGSNVVVDSDIGSTVQAYDADTAKYDDATANFTGTLQNGGSDVVVDSDIGSTVQAYDGNLTSFVSAFTLPTSDGTADQVLKTNGSGTLSFADASGGGTLGTLTKTFTANETATITLTDSVLVPLVSVTKEVGDPGGTNNSWDVNSNTENYTRLNSATATTLDFGGFDISTAKSTCSLSVSDRSGNPEAIAFNANGTKMFLVDWADGDVKEYTMSTAYDLSTASYSQRFSVQSQEMWPGGIAFNTNGTKMFIVGFFPSGPKVYEYTLSTGFDISTATYSQNFSVSSQDTSARGIAFSSNGTKMFIAGFTNSAIYEYTLSTGFDVSTASYSQNFSVASQDTQVRDVTFNTDGTKMFVVGSVGDNIYEYDLSTGFDVSTASYSTSVSAINSSPSGIAFNSDGTKMFVCDENSYEIYRYNLSTGFDVSTATHNFSVSSQTTYPYQIAFNTNGTKMFILGSAAVSEYTLSTGFDTTTASYSQNFSVSSEETDPRGMAFNNDGTKMFIVGVVGDDVNEYTLSTGFDVSTASYSQNFSVASQETLPEGIAFNTDGTKMFIVGASGDDVNEYTLSTGFDVSTASYSRNFSISAQTTNPTEIAFSTDGTKMFIVGSGSSYDVYEYTLSTGFNVSTATYSQNFSIYNQETQIQGIAFNTNGTKMFIVGASGDDVNEYNLDHTFVSLGTGSFTSADLGKTIYANSGEFILTSTGGAFVENTAPTSYAQVASGDWEMYAVVYNTTDGDLELSGTIVDAFDISTAIYVNNFSIKDQETSPTGIAFNTNGTKMFIVGYDGDDVNEYTLTTGFDVSTASYSQNFSVASQDTAPRDIAFNTDGTKMFILGDTGNDVNEYTLSTGFDVSTASFVDSFSVASQTTAPRGITFNTDGTLMYIIAATSYYRYNLSTGFDLSTASSSGSGGINSTVETLAVALAFNADGSKAYLLGDSGNDVNEYTLANPFDFVSVAAGQPSQTFSVSTQDTSPTGIAFNNDGTKMFILGETGDDVNEYNIGTIVTPSGYSAAYTATSTDSTNWTDINSMTADESANNGNIYYAVSTDDRTTWSVAHNTDGIRNIVRNNAGTWEYNSNSSYGSETWAAASTNTELSALEEAMEAAEYVLGSGFDLSTVSYSQNFSVSAQDWSPQDIAFNTDGTKMFIVGDAGNDVNEYTLGTGFDVSTASYSQNFSVNPQETEPKGIAFNTDGTKMFIVGTQGVDVNEYTLSTGFDVSTASYSRNFSVSSQDVLPQGIAFNTNGTKMFIIGYNGRSVYEYTLSTGFNVSTASYSQNFDVTSQEAIPQGIAFNTNGTKMFIVGISGREVNEYTLSTGFDVSTASYSKVISVEPQETDPRGMAFNTDGTKMFIVGTSGKEVNEYTIGTWTSRNRMNKTQLEAVSDANHFTLGNDLDLAIIFNLSKGSIPPSSDGVSVNYEGLLVNEGAILGTDYTFNTPAQNSVKITAVQAGNYKVRVL